MGASDREPRATGQLARRLLLAAAVGLLLYGGFFAFAEYLVYEYGDRNRFFQVATAEAEVDHIVLLGASRALPFEFGDAHETIEELADAPVLNLAMPGAGIVPNYLIVDYFLSMHNAQAMIYFVDSFAFYSSEWNEDRLLDSRLWQRAPHNALLARSLWRATREWRVDQIVLRNYVSGFSKINDPTTWFEPDIWEDEQNFEDVYTPDTWRDSSRIEFLYPDEIEEQVFRHYLSLFIDLLEELDNKGIPLIVVKAPLRTDFYEQLPGEQAFDERLRQLLEEHDVQLYDFSSDGFDSSLFYDPDHLNREGVTYFLEQYMESILNEINSGAAIDASIRAGPANR